MRLKQWAATRVAAMLLTMIGCAQAGTYVDIFAKNGAATGQFYGSGSVATAADAAGNVYTVGSLNKSGGAMTMGGFTLNAVGTQDAYVAKIGPTGNVLWAHTFGGPLASTFLNTVALDSAGNIYAAGDFFGANVASLGLTKMGTQDGWLIKLDNNGNVLWARSYGGNGAQVDLYGVAADSSGNVAVVGDFGLKNLSRPALTKISTTSTNFDALAIKVDANGNTLWAHNAGGPLASTSASSIAFDSQQNPVIVGGVTGGNLTVPVQAISGYEDGFVFQLNSAGGINWVKMIGNGPVNTAATRVAVDSANNIGVVGTFSGGNISSPSLVQGGTGSNVFAIKLNASGAVLFGQDFASTSFCGATGVSFDGLGNMVASGWCDGGNMTSPAITVNADNMFTFAVELSTVGNVTWSTALVDTGYSVSASPATNFAIDGSRTIAFSGTINNFNFTVSDAAVAKIPLP